MFYKPNYCCNCGEKIERIEWNLLTNRRFCQLCETEYQLDDWLKRIVPIIFCLVGVFGIGSYFQQPENSFDITKAEKNAVIPNPIDKNSAVSRTLKNSDIKSVADNNGNPDTQDIRTKTETESLKNNSSFTEGIRQVEKVKSPQKSADGTVYFCGAETKKGTPCSRKVKGGGRCWQHKGRDAILADKQLLAESN